MLLAFAGAGCSPAVWLQPRFQCGHCKPVWTSCLSLHPMAYCSHTLVLPPSFAHRLSCLTLQDQPCPKAAQGNSTTGSPKPEQSCSPPTCTSCVWRHNKVLGEAQVVQLLMLMVVQTVLLPCQHPHQSFPPLFAKSMSNMLIVTGHQTRGPGPLHQGRQSPLTIYCLWKEGSRQASVHGEHVARARVRWDWSGAG
jgi:hypothetical protein